MFVKCNSTRKTSIGMFRRGFVYKLDEKNQTHENVLNLHTEGAAPALKRLTEKQAEKERAAVIDLLPENEG